jgi:hypothetical protein
MNRIGTLRRCQVASSCAGVPQLDLLVLLTGCGVHCSFGFLPDRVSNKRCRKLKERTMSQSSTNFAERLACPIVAICEVIVFRVTWGMKGY